MLDERMLRLLQMKEVSCTLRKQPQHLTKWFNERLGLYQALFPLVSTKPAVQGVLDELYTLLKFVSKPNDPWRKDAIIKEYWPPLMAKIATI